MILSYPSNLSLISLAIHPSTIHPPIHPPAYPPNHPSIHHPPTHHPSNHYPPTHPPIHHPSILPSFCPSVHPFAHLSPITHSSTTHPSLHLLLSPFTLGSIHPSIRPSLFLPIHPSFFPCAHPSIFPLRSAEGLNLLQLVNPLDRHHLTPSLGKKQRLRGSRSSWESCLDCSFSSGHLLCCLLWPGAHLLMEPHFPMGPRRARARGLQGCAVHGPPAP